MPGMDSATPIKLPGFTAASDLTASQYLFVKIVAGTKTVTPVTALADRPVGVLVNKPKSGEAAEVVVLGITPVIAGETVAAGDMLSVLANGKASNDTAQAGTTYQGRILSAGAVNELVTALINCVV